ncbi:hypothetical protein AB2F06_26480 (plasmid) [Escherichia coli]
MKNWLKGHIKLDSGKFHNFSPFVEVSWLHNTHDFGVRMNGIPRCIRMVSVILEK